MLQQTAARLKQCVRETDTVTRLGGDEFTIILPQIRSARDVGVAPSTSSRRWRRRSASAGNEHFLSASIGIALYPGDGTSGDELLRNADTAMYRAKESGRGRYVYFEERMNIAALARVSLERDLRRAIERNEFSVAYQPQLDLRSGPHFRRGSAAALGLPGRRAAHAGRIHPARGGNGTHRTDRRMGAARGVPAISGLASGGHRAASHRRERFRASVQAEGVRRDGPGGHSRPPESRPHAWSSRSPRAC